MGVPLTSFAQSPAARTPLEDQIQPEEVVYLSPFEISSDRGSTYRATESNSARIRQPIMETPASINIITKEFMEDMAVGSILDATQWLSGMTLPVLGGTGGIQERQTVRGFEIFGSTIDGFTGLGSYAANTEPMTVERVEVYKGPNAVLAPNGSPGGVTMLISKSPEFKPASNVKVELATKHFGNKLGLDTTGPVPFTDNFAYRLIVTHQDTHSYVPGSLIDKGLTPMLTWRFSERSQLKLKGFLQNWHHIGQVASNANNLYLKHDTPFGKVIDFDDIQPEYEIGGPNGGSPDSMRRVKLRRATAEFLTTLGDHFDLRAAMLRHSAHTTSGGSYLYVHRPLADNVRRVDPHTGIHTDLNWQQPNPNQPWDPITNDFLPSPIDYTPSPRPAFGWPTPVEARAGYSDTWAQELHYQVDLNSKWVFGQASSPWLTLNTVTGVSYSKGWSDFKGHDVSPFEPLPWVPEWTVVPFVGYGPVVSGNMGPPRTWGKNAGLGDKRYQYYAYARIGTLRNRLLISAGASTQSRKGKGTVDFFGPQINGEYFPWGTPGVTRGFIPAGAPATPYKDRTVSPDPTISALYKVASWISVYSIYSTNSEAGSVRLVTNEPQVPLWREGQQAEVGVKLELLNRKLLITSAYYDLRKTNITSDHPDQWRPEYRDPNGNVITQLPHEVSNITNKGFELDVTGNITANLSLVASYTDMKMRDDAGRPKANIPDNIYTALVRYKFTQSILKGLNIYIGYMHRGKNPGEDPGRYTELGVLRQPTFWMPERKDTNAGASYNWGKIRFQVNIDNLTNRKQLASSGGRHAIGWLPQRNVRLTTSYNW